MPPMLTDPDDAVFRSLSREGAFSTDAAGIVAWTDVRARDRFGLRVGVALRERAAPGAEDKVQRLIERARVERVERWELVLVIDGAPRSVVVAATPHAGGVLCVASLAAEDYGRVLGEVGAALGELASAHRDLARQARELSERGAEVERLNRDLSDSGRGVIALHAELDEKATSLREATETKTRVLANVSHEFRTPLNSILGLSRLLLSRTDGELTPEQEKQIGFIRRAAETLSELVNDLLDLSKLQAGKAAFRPTRFTADGLFGALRGMLRPLVTSETVALVFEDPAPDIVLDTDEGKVAQILRNLISNALKFTERGEVRVTARAGPGDSVVFAVADTGIGIDPEDQPRIFEEFTQIDGPLQRRVKGTGLGLSLSRRLATLLCGEISVSSAPGAGSTFALTVPRVHPDVADVARLEQQSETLDPARSPVLVVEDDRQTLLLYEKYLEGSGFQVVPARTVDDARAVLTRLRPAAVVLDIVLEGESTWRFLGEMKSSPRTRDIPTLVVTVTDREQKARALGADEFYLKPIEQEWLLKKLRALARRGPVEKILVIDDDEVSRYLVRKLLADTDYSVLEAAGGPEGVRLARQEQPHVIFLDFVMPEMSAFEVLDELKMDPKTRSIPVIIHTSQNLAEHERARLAAETAAIVSKQSLSREVAIARIREALMKAGIRPAPA